MCNLERVHRSDTGFILEKAFHPLSNVLQLSVDGEIKIIRILFPNC